MKIKLLKLLDLFVGFPVVRLLSSPKGKLNRAISKVLFIRPGGIGDAVLLIPSIQLFKMNFPKAAIDLLAEKRNSAVFQLCPEIDVVLHYDRPRELLKVLRANYDIVIDTEQWHRLSAIVARLTEAPVTIGYATNERKRLFTNPIDYSHDDYEASSFLHLLKPLMGEIPARFEVPFLTIPIAAAVAARNQLSLIANRDFVVLFPGGSVVERKWESARFHKLAKLLVAKGYGIIVVGGKEDIWTGEKIIEDLPHSLNLSGKTTLPQTAVILKEASLLITDDSGIMHLGYGLGVKIIALFGPGREKKWAPRGSNCAVINKHLPCSPCTTFGYTPSCKTNALCMRSISVEEVYNAAMILLKDSYSSQIAKF